MSVMMRLDKLLTTLGEGSRTEVTRLIRRGHVLVDGETIKDSGLRVNAAAITLSVSGRALTYKPHRHVMMNKPTGLLTAARDRHCKTVVDLLSPLYLGCACMPVGRLDKDTEGFLLLTSDGELAHRVLSPRREIDKVYLATVDGPLNQEDVLAFREGLELSDFTAQGALLEILESSPESARAKVTVQEGKFHQIKRMFAARERTVTALKRLSIGPLPLDPTLECGTYRELTPSEEAALFAAVDYTPKI